MIPAAYKKGSLWYPCWLLGFGPNPLGIHCAYISQPGNNGKISWTRITNLLVFEPQQKDN